jgi:hypothetical protein
LSAGRRVLTGSPHGCAAVLDGVLELQSELLRLQSAQVHSGQAKGPALDDEVLDRRAPSWRHRT